MKNNELNSAVKAMRLLNVRTKNFKKGELRDYILDLKDLFIDYLYVNKYCNSVQIHVQTVSCINHAHTIGEPCPDCKNTGIFARNNMYVYRFNVDGEIFSFHQPTERAITVPRVTNYTEFDAIENKKNLFDNTTVKEKIATVYNFLINRKYAIRPLNENILSDVNNQKIRIPIAYR